LRIRATSVGDANDINILAEGDGAEVQYPSSIQEYIPSDDSVAPFRSFMGFPAAECRDKVAPFNTR